MTSLLSDLISTLVPMLVIMVVHVVTRTDGRSILNQLLDEQLQNSSPSSSASGVDQSLHVTALKDTSIAMADLVHHTRSAYSVLCHSHPLPSEDPSLSTCDGYAKFISDFHGQVLDLPTLLEVTVPEQISVMEFAEEVLGSVLGVATRYRYVIANVTTFESTYICMHEHGVEACSMECQLSIYAFWCQLHKLQARLNSLVALVKYSMRSLGMKDHTRAERVFVQSAPDSRQIIRLYYSFGAIYRLLKQSEHMRYIMQLTENLIN